MTRIFSRRVTASLLTSALLVATGCTALPQRPAPVITSPHPADMVNLLRQGGYVIYFRHSKTDFTQKDVTSNYDDCSGQRNLTDEGRAQAKTIGIAIAKLGIPINRVVASPYCRTRETAELAFGKYERAEHYEVAKTMTKDLLSAPPPAGTNIVIVAHGFIMRDIAHVLLAEGDAVVFKPRNKDDQGAVARVPSEMWTNWAAGNATPARPVLRTVQEYPIPEGTYAHDVAPAKDGTVWWTAQSTGQLGRLDPATGKSELIALGAGSRPHGVVVGADGAAWVTDGGLNAIVRVDGKTQAVRVFALPSNHADANLNTAAFD